MPCPPERTSINPLNLLRLVIMMAARGLDTWSGAHGQPVLQQNGDIRDYCQLEHFSANCKENEVIVMTSARFGRMELGRCVLKDYGSLGCAADVLTQVDRLCSGRRTCDFPVTQLRLSGYQPCPGDLTLYLQASFYCQTVTEGSPRACSASNPVPLSSSSSGYIANSITLETGRGSPDCPWEIRVLPGQKINITLVNFARIALLPEKAADQTYDRAALQARPKVCYQYAKINEGDYLRTLTECEGGQRLVHAYLSTSNVLRLNILTRNSKDIHFILYYEAVGCPHPELPASLWVQRHDGDKAHVRCNATGKTWELTCSAQHWVGEIGNCTPSVAAGGLWNVGHLFEADAFPYSILIVVAIGVALGVFLGGILLVCASRYFKRRRRETRQNHQTETYIPENSKMMVASYDDNTLHRHALVDSIHYEKAADIRSTTTTTTVSTTAGEREISAKPPFSPYGSLPPPGYPGTRTTSSHVYESPRFGRKDS